MDHKNIVINYEEYKSNDGLPKEDAELLAMAENAADGAYAPYSQFKVGAAVRLKNGKTVSASNQENAAYPSGLCAERVALFYAHARYPGESVVSIAITAKVNGVVCKMPTSPCGACRQVMAESEERGGEKIRIIIGGSDVTQVVISTESLLPFIFNNLPK